MGPFGAGADSCGGETSHLPGDDRSGAARLPTPTGRGWLQPPAHLRATRKVFVPLVGISQEMEGSPYSWQEKEAIFVLNKAAPMSKVPQ